MSDGEQRTFYGSGEHNSVPPMRLEPTAPTGLDLDKLKFQRKIVNILPIIFSLCFGCSKETVLLSTHNICFG